MKKIIILVSSVFILASCGSDNENSGQNDSLIEVGTSVFSMQIPASWEQNRPDNESIPDPQNSDVVIAASSPDTSKGFSNNIIVLSQELPSPLSSEEYSILNNVGANKKYVNYLLLENKNLTFIDEAQSGLYIFEAKYNSATPTFKFLQTGRVCGENQAFFLTIALSTDIKGTAKYEEILESFACKS